MPVVIGRRMLQSCRTRYLNLSAAFGWALSAPRRTILAADGEVFRRPVFPWEVLAIPGHSAGHVAYLWRGQDPFIVFVGDIIFSGSVGRTDFPDGDFDQLARAFGRACFHCPTRPCCCPVMAPRPPSDARNGPIRLSGRLVQVTEKAVWGFSLNYSLISPFPSSLRLRDCEFQSLPKIPPLAVEPKCPYVSEVANRWNTTDELHLRPLGTYANPPIVTVCIVSSYAEHGKRQVCCRGGLSGLLVLDTGGVFMSVTRILFQTASVAAIVLAGLVVRAQETEKVPAKAPVAKAADGRADVSVTRIEVAPQASPAQPGAAAQGVLDMGKLEMVTGRYPNGKIKIEREVGPGRGRKLRQPGHLQAVCPRRAKWSSPANFSMASSMGKWTQQFAKDEGHLFFASQDKQWSGPFTSEATFQDGHSTAFGRSRTARARASSNGTSTTAPATGPGPGGIPTARNAWKRLTSMAP